MDGAGLTGEGAAPDASGLIEGELVGAGPPKASGPAGRAAAPLAAASAEPSGALAAPALELFAATDTSAEPADLWPLCEREL